MFLLDVNVVLALHREDHPHHPIARRWFDGMVARRQAFAVPDTVWVSLVRLATHHRIFVVPSPLDEVSAFMRAVRAQVSYAPMNPGSHYLEILEDQCRSADISGDLVPDAAFAALAVEYGCTLVSFDRDFARFPKLSWVVPA